MEKTKIFVDIVFEGSNFSPRRLQEATWLRLTSLAEANEIARLGRYKGRVSPYGLAMLRIEGSTSEELSIILDNALKYLILEKNSLKDSGVEEIYLDTDIIEELGIELSNKVFESLKILNDSLSSDTNLKDIAGRFSINFEPYILNLYSIFLLKDIPIHSHQFSAIEFLKRNSLPEENLDFKFSNSDFVYRNENFLSIQRNINLTHLIVNVLNSNPSYLKIDKDRLFKFIFLYLLTYGNEDLSKVPSFEEILRSNIT